MLAITPNDAAAYDSYALALAADDRLDDAKAKMAKAVELDPKGAGEYHYNLGALLMNRNQTDGALDEFKKAIDADPNYADAYFYYGSTLVGKATMDPSTGKMTAPPGTVEALQKYVQLKPDGSNAESAKALIAALGGSVQTKYSDPNAAPPKATKKSTAQNKRHHEPPQECFFHHCERPAKLSVAGLNIPLRTRRRLPSVTSGELCRVEE